MSDGDEDMPGISTTSPWTGDAILKALDVAFRNSLKEDSPQIPQPAAIKVPLRPHQRALIAAMKEREMASMNGIPYHGTKTYADYGVLGDEVGSGKSLVILGYLAHLKEQGGFSQVKNTLYRYSYSHLFTVYSRTYPDTSGTSLIVVPHTLFRQWQTYTKLHTNLNIYFAKTSKDIYGKHLQDASGESIFGQTLLNSDAVLVSNTLYDEMMVEAKRQGVLWKRIFIDEADSIYIPSTNPKPNAAFTWFITATWPNFIFNGNSIRPHLLEYYEQNQAKFSEGLGAWLKAELGIQQYAGYNFGRTTWLRVRSTNWLRGFQSDHPLRAVTLLMSHPDFLKSSQHMPGIQEQTILCLQPRSHQQVLSLVNPQVRNMIHAGNIEGALSELGVDANTSMGIVEAATAEREKELDRLRKTLAFKQTMDYATPKAKEDALASLQSKISHIDAQLKTFRERLTSTTTEECPICYEDPKQNAATLTPCCSRIFCGGCILQSMERGLSCPMCRSSIQTNQLVRIVEKEKAPKKKKKIEEASKLLSKQRQLIKFLKEHPEARVLVFSRYENPFINLEADCDSEGITYHTLRGNKDAIAATIKAFEKGEKRVLFLPTQSAGAGLNLVTATHIVMLHAMTPEEEKQVVGRAYRLGRTMPLNVVRLVHEGESVYTS
jgi:SNF2 family DNA or RNA helicase